jgi:hypothetical protein
MARDTTRNAHACGGTDRDEHDTGTQRSIDISGDGPNNRGPAVYEVRDEIVAKGITINGLPVVSTGEYGTGDWGIYYGELENYYVNCVIGGPRAFAIPAKGFEEFAAAIRHKLVLEISDAGRISSPIVKVAAVANELRPPAVLRPPPGGGTAEQCGGAGASALGSSTLAPPLVSRNGT